MQKKDNPNSKCRSEHYYVADNRTYIVILAALLQSNIILNSEEQEYKVVLYCVDCKKKILFYARNFKPVKDKLTFFAKGYAVEKAGETDFLDFSSRKIHYSNIVEAEKLFLSTHHGRRLIC
jgi:hypothetical protein